MSNSSLVSFTKISPNKNSPRNHKIDTITIHCYCAQASVEDAGEWFGRSTTKASCNYMIGTDGRVGLIVDESDRSWCTSSSSNDNRAITIECASDKTDPYAINDTVYDKLIDLCTDICKRNGIQKMIWKDDKSLIGQIDKQNVTVHRWFKNKDCPGEYIFSRLDKICDEVNSKLNPSENSELSPFQVYVKIPDLNVRSKPSMDSDIVGVTGKGTFTITDVSIRGWGKLKSGMGWIYLGNKNYVEAVEQTISNTAEVKGFTPYSVSVDIPNLNIRTNPTTDSDTNGLTGKGTFTITAEQPGKGSSKGWGRLKSGAGWISLDFAKRI